MRVRGKDVVEWSDARGDGDKDHKWVNLWPDREMSKKKPGQSVVITRFNRLMSTHVQVHENVDRGEVDVPCNLNMINHQAA